MSVVAFPSKMPFDSYMALARENLERRAYKIFLNGNYIKSVQTYAEVREYFESQLACKKEGETVFFTKGSRGEYRLIIGGNVYHAAQGF